LKKNLNNVNFQHISPRTENILERNEFLSYFGKSKRQDYKHTTIKYLKLEPEDGKFFKNYIIQELLAREELPTMSQPLKNKMIEAIYEIFVNAQMHSNCEFIYTCGQFFPKKNKIEFTIVDNGIGFKEKVNRRFDTQFSALQAIKWAVIDRNTTKKIPGGIGLALLHEFVQKNRGKIQIISAEGYYEYSEANIIYKEFKGEFPGTIVNLQFKTDDSSDYLLKSEVNDINDIF